MAQTASADLRCTSHVNWPRGHSDGATKPVDIANAMNLPGTRLNGFGLEFSACVGRLRDNRALRTGVPQGVV